LLTRNAAQESRKGKQQSKLRALLEQHRTDRDCFLEARKGALSLQRLPPA